LNATGDMYFVLKKGKNQLQIRFVESSLCALAEEASSTRIQRTSAIGWCNAAFFGVFEPN
jgi:hypothetical protein